MKRIIFALAAVSVLFASCQKTAVNKNQKDGFLSFGEFSLDVDDSVITKSAIAASGTYRISIQDADGVEIMEMSYSEVKNNDNMITLPAGSYTLVATSEDSVPVAAFDPPVYGASKDFKITAGDIVLIPGKLLHRTAGEGGLRYLVHFSRGFVEKFFTDTALEPLLKDQAVVFRPENREGTQIQSILNVMLSEFIQAERERMEKEKNK